MRILILFAGLLPLLVAQDAPKPAQESAPQQETKKSEEAQKPAETKPDEKAAGEQAAAAPAPADRVITGSVGLGYRWRSDVAGNFDAYRTVVNLGEGPKVFDFDFTIQNPSSKYYDKITVFGMGWGGEPATTTRLDAYKERIYDFHFDYRNVAYYNFLPSFANPRIDQGIFQTQRGYDLQRRTIDTELRLRPGTRIIPYIAYLRNWGDGRGVTNFVSSGNEYPIFNGLYDKTDQYRAGVSFEYTNFHVTLEQGGTTFKDDQTASTSDRNPGNRTTPYFGQTLYLTNALQAYRVRGDSIFERGVVTLTPWSWLDASASFLYSRPRTEVQFTQTAAGSLANISTLQFFTSQRDFAAANANQPHTSGNINLEIRPLPRLRILESWMTDRFHTASAVLLNEITSITPQSVAALSTDRLAVNYNRQQIQANFDVLRWLTVRAGHRYVWGDARVRAPLENEVAFQQGELSQQVALLGTQARLFGQKLWINGDAEIANADRVYFRTSLSDYRKGTVRARYQLLGSLSLNANFAALTNQNPNPDIKFDLESYMTSAGFLWNPGGGKIVTIAGDYTRSSLRSNLNYFVPQTLTPAVSQYNENAHTATAMVDVAPPIGAKHAPKLSLGGSFFRSSGTRPTSYYMPLVKIGVPVNERVNIFSEWRYYGLSETYYSYEGFRAHTFVVGLRVMR
jgi:hypothetical protein